MKCQRPILETLLILDNQNDKIMQLKKVLLINAISSGSTGILLALLPEMFAGLFQIKAITPFIEVGIFLIIFAFFVLFTAYRTPISKKLTQIIIGIDIMWVIASGMATWILFPTISMLGSIMIIAVAGWVGLMAILQKKTLKII